jgi:hypothetical protein
MRAIIHVAEALLACTIVLPGAAFAAEESHEPVPIAAAEQRSAAPAEPRKTGNIGAAIDADKLDADKLDANQLDSYRGGTDSFTEVLNKAQLNGVVGSNTAVNVATGSNAINDGAFSNASGLPTVIQNTGANVLIQNSLIVNLQLK